jgi:hypothetical protein
MNDLERSAFRAASGVKIVGGESSLPYEIAIRRAIMRELGGMEAYENAIRRAIMRELGDMEVGVIRNWYDFGVCIG